MQAATVELDIEVSNLTADAVDEVANAVGVTAEQTAAFRDCGGRRTLDAGAPNVR